MQHSLSSSDTEAPIETVTGLGVGLLPQGPRSTTIIKLTNRIAIGTIKRPHDTKSALYCDKTTVSIIRSRPKKACPAMFSVRLFKISAKISPVNRAANIMDG